MPRGGGGGGNDGMGGGERNGNGRGGSNGGSRRGGRWAGQGLDCKAQLCIGCKAGNGKKHLVVVWFQMESTGKVAAMVIARIEHKPEQLGVGDEF